MNLLTTLLSLAALASLSTSQSIGSPCSNGNQGVYTCSANRNVILICNLGTWQLSARCGTGCCITPETLVDPYCGC
ncbi:uncharacterized protein BDV17DRAFT_264915 [Aspergillus undulatus]|uniref:uncharacterized protein n=1 Tax=Aspergillus undulatus TaxID=1810928 RepID=UPI003CCC9B05